MATNSQQQQADNLNKFEGLLREAFDKPWWREFQRLVAERREAKTASLINPMAGASQRDEDKLRGEIMALAWIMAIDDHGKRLRTEEAPNG